MYVRLLFVLLAALNLGAAGWLVFAGAPSRAMPPATDPGVPELQLVSTTAPLASPVHAAQPVRVPTSDTRHATSTGAQLPATTTAVAARVSAQAPAASGSAGTPSPVTSAVSSGPRVPLPSSAGSSDLASTPAASRDAHPASMAPGSARATPGATVAGSAESAPTPQLVASAASAGAAPEHAGSTGPAAVSVCTSLGPFTSEADARTALKTLSPHIARIRYREAEVSRPRGYWVFLPPTASRDAAQAEARALVAKGIHDYYIVGGGDTPNAISLGVYNDELNAQNRVNQAEKAGFHAQMKRRVDTEPEYWLDFAVAKGAAFQWQQWLPGRKDLGTKPAACF